MDEIPPAEASLSRAVPPDMADVVRAGVKAGREVPGAVALGGTVCALYAGHRLSIDVDFVVADLERKFDEVREHLLEVNGWEEARVRPPVLILGSMDHIRVGFRQQRRKRPIEAVQMKTDEGVLTVPTLEEMIRIKAFLAYDRNAMRDFIDLAELTQLAGLDRSVDAVSNLDSTLAWEKQPQVLLEVIKTLLVCQPRDGSPGAFASFKWLTPRLTSWQQVRTACVELGERLAVRNIIEEP